MLIFTLQLTLHGFPMSEEESTSINDKEFLENVMSMNEILSEGDHEVLNDLKRKTEGKDYMMR